MTGRDVRLQRMTGFALWAGTAAWISLSTASVANDRINLALVGAAVAVTITAAINSRALDVQEATRMALVAGYRQASADHRAADHR